jgi:hypothetical protein
MATEKDGHSKGFAFVEFEQEVRLEQLFITVCVLLTVVIGREMLRQHWLPTTMN